MTSFISKKSHIFIRWVALLVALIATTASLLQAANIRPVFADDGGYPWVGATCIDGTDCSSSYNWGYSLPCPQVDPSCTTYEYPNSTNPTAGMGDTWGYGVRNCTSYAAWAVNLNENVSINGWGQAYQWATNAPSNEVHPASGYTPQKGDIAEWDATTSNPYGHVAYVFAVSGSTASFDEYNSGYPKTNPTPPAQPQFQWGLFYNQFTSANYPAGGPNHYIHVGTPTATSAITPAAIDDANGVLNVFKVGGDHQLYQNYWNAGINNWNGWTSIGSSMFSNPAVIINGNALNVFERGGNGQIYTEYDGSNGWSGWSSLGSHQMKGNPIVMFYGTSMNVFALDTSNVPYEDTWTSANGWLGWGSRGNSMASDPAAVSYGGNLHLIFRGGDNKPYDDVFGTGGWGGFGEIGQYASVSGNPSALSYGAEGELDVYFGTSNNQIWKDTNQGSGWGTWTEMATGSMTGDPYIMAYNNDLQVFSRDTSNNIETRYWSYSGQSWSSWQSLGGSSDNLASDPFAYQNGSSELDVYASDGSANAYDDTKIAPNNWGGFSELN